MINKSFISYLYVFDFNTLAMLRVHDFILPLKYVTCIQYFRLGSMLPDDRR
jgi:hypothetical protein